MDEGKKKKTLEKALGDMDHWMERFDVVIIGPGLGRDPLVHHVVKEVSCGCTWLGIALPCLVMGDAPA